MLGVESRLSTGLSRPDLYNWFVRFGETISELRPTVVVFSFGADDAHDFMAGVPGGGRWGRRQPEPGKPNTDVVSSG